MPEENTAELKEVSFKKSIKKYGEILLMGIILILLLYIFMISINYNNLVDVYNALYQECKVINTGGNLLLNLTWP